MSDDDFARFIRRMPLIVKNASQWIVEYGMSLFKTHFVFTEVSFCFYVIPFKSQLHYKPRLSFDPLPILQLITL